ncbi:MAG TPA: hypothetical protein VHF47_06200 [Acidimicrobiales bacterium]|nr:hypothetical protein [Acidimicrobiales bacterium]
MSTWVARMVARDWSGAERIDPVAVARLAHRRAARRVAATLLGAVGVAAVLGASGEVARRAVHDDGPPVTVAPPGAPAVAAEAVDSHRVRLSWPTSSGSPTHYVVYRGDQQLATTTAPGFDDTGLEPGRSYEYAVEAVAADGTRSGRSEPAEVRTPPIRPPSDLRAAVTDTGVTLTWERSTDQAVTGYRVSRSGGMAPAIERGASFEDRTAQPGQTYTYSVQAVDAHGHRSRPVSRSVEVPERDTQAPSTPADVEARYTPMRIELTWSESTDNVAVKEYRVYRERRAQSADGSTTWVDREHVGTTLGPPFSDEIGRGERYAFRYAVQAVDTSGNVSKLSEWASVPVVVD